MSVQADPHEAEDLQSCVFVKVFQGGDLAEGLVLEEELERLSHVLEKLHERERDLIFLHYYKEYTLKQIAEMMGMSYGNAKVVHKKALKALEREMQD